jgi:D-arabinose 1-dehydrogenase-like Zn-dependent alcohol dehydrogenase
MGKAVTRVKVGDAVGVGVMVDACLQCDPCKAGEEQNCKKGNVSTYNGTDKYGRAASPCGYTLGGYTSKMVVHERFAIVVPPNYPLEFAGPVMCSGVTLFDPLRRHGATTGTKVGIIGLGGLGQQAGAGQQGRHPGCRLGRPGQQVSAVQHRGLLGVVRG